MKFSVKKILFIQLVFFFILSPVVVAAETPNDPKVNPLPWQYEQIGVDDAWDKTTGSDSVTIAIIDNGFDHLHPDLINNAWRNKDEIPGNNKDDDNNGYVDDVWGWSFIAEDYNNDGEISPEEEEGSNDPRPNVFDLRDVSEKTVHHGTIVAGLVGAEGNNGLAGAGINWDVNLMNLKIVDNDGGGSMEAVPEAIKYAVDNGADIISFSLVGDLDEEKTKEMKRLVDYAYENDVAMFAAAGNRRKNLEENPMQPVCADESLEGKMEKIIGVSAVDSSRLIARFSNRGLKCIDITAPGVNMSSTVRYAPNYDLKKKFDGKWNGTSFAVPLVSGTAGLIKSIKPKWGPKKIYDTILQNVFNSKGSKTKKYQKLFGNGLLRTDRAVEQAWSHASIDFDINGLLSISPSGNIADAAFVDLDSDLKTPFSDLSDEINNIDKVEKHTVVLIEEKDRKKIRIYSKIKQEKKRRSWPIELKQLKKVENLEAGDINNDDVIEVILSYKDKNGNSHVSIFQQSGKMLLQREFENKLKSLNVIHGLSEDRLVALLEGGEGDYLSFLKINLNQDRKIDLYFRGDDLKSGDIDGDKQAELIVSSYNNSAPLLSYLEQNGTIKNRFYAYDPSYTSDFKTIVGDVNSDQKDEVITVSTIRDKIKAWSEEVEVIKQAPSFGLDSHLLPLISE